MCDLFEPFPFSTNDRHILQMSIATSLASFNIFNAALRIYVMQLFIVARPPHSDESNAISVVLINYFVYLWRWKGSNNRRIRQNSNHKPVIYVHLSNAKKERKLQEFKKKKKEERKNVCWVIALLAPDKLMIFYFARRTSLLLLLLLFMLTRQSLILRCSLFVLFCLLFSDNRPFIEALQSGENHRK